jgi:Domain of Unknown Function with PDB structure (DUF3857)/Transglutaminase-like superfamily
MKRNRLLLLGWLLWAPLLCVAQSYDWIPLTQQDFQFKEVPGNPAAPAVLLYHADYINYVSDFDQSEFLYNRIKVLTDAGKSEGDVEIPLTPWTKIHDLEARTIQPDGTISPFTSQPFEKVVVKARNYKIMALTFALPNVMVGSIIEYKYQLQSTWVYSDFWSLEHDLFTVKEHFLFKHSGPFRMSFIVNGSQAKPLTSNGRYELELNDVPAFHPEEQMPPKENYKASVRFFWNTLGGWRSFWYQKAREWSLEVNNFIGDYREIHAAAEEAIGNATDPEEKIRRLYARAQEIRNLQWERERTREEIKKEHLKENHSVVDVLKHGHGGDWDITSLFVAMARSAGFDASVILVASKEHRFFVTEYLKAQQYNSPIAGVVVNGKNLLLEPATRFCPFGSVRWINTGTSAVKLGKNDWNFISMPTPGPDRAEILRSTCAALDSEGTLRGHITLTFQGSDALERRLLALGTDETGRNKILEADVTRSLPSQSSVKLKDSQGWQQSGGPLVADFEIEVPGYATRAGHRLLLPSTVFSVKNKATFESNTRRYPVYFGYAFSEVDLTVIDVQDGYAIESLPETVEKNTPFGTYKKSSKTNDRQVITSRSFTIKDPLVNPDRFTELKAFFSQIQAADDNLLVLSPAMSPSNK